MINNTSEKLVIVEKAQSMFDTDKGLVLPLAIYNSDTTELTPVQSQDFPNGKIFISQGYEYIDNKYKDGELFYFNYDDINESTDFIPNELSNKHKFWAFGNKAKEVDKNLLIPIIETNLPDLSNGLMPSITYLPDNIFFISNNGIFYGPYQSSEFNGDFYAHPISTLTHLMLKQNHVAKYHSNDIKFEHVISINKNNEKHLFIKNFKLLPKPSETLDIISDEKLIKEFSKIGFAGKKNLLGKNEAQKLATAINDATRHLKLTGDNPRMDRVKKILGDFIEQSGYQNQIIDDYFSESIDGRKYLDSYLEKHKDKLIEEKFKDLDKNFIEKQNEFSEKLINLQDEYNVKKQNLENEINEKKQKYLIEMAQIKQDTEEKIKLLEESELNEKKNQLTLDIQELEKQYKEIYNLKDIHNQCNKLSAKKDMLFDEIKKSEKELDKTKELIEKQKYLLQSPEIVNRALEFDTLQKLLSKQHLLAERAIISDGNHDQNIIISKYELSSDTKEDYISYITNYFNEIYSGCTLSEVEIANILLSISQSFLTVFSGPPGVGKTSSVFKMAQALGIANEHQTPNLLNISVGRSWVSSRDLLGFYNPLRDVYQPARTGLYPFLSKDSEFLKLILLDEANLSSLEHYWSDFLTMCDTQSPKVIDTGIPNTEERHLYINENIRFIATINNDGTTERLSPRLIDRAPIIHFEYMNSEASSKILNDFSGAIKSKILLEHFGIGTTPASLNTQQRNILDEILAILISDEFKSPKIRVSPRKINSIKHYCQAANELESIFIDSNIAIDFVIAQHILPLIEGFGLEYKRRLSKLRDTLHNKSLKKSTSILDNIIKSGEYHSDSYSFF